MTLGRGVTEILLILGLLLGPSATNSIHSADTPFPQATAVYGVIATDPVYLAVAQERGFFKKNGIEINLTHIPTNQAVQALSGGKIQFTTVGPQVVDANLAGADIVYIMGVVNTFVLSMYGKPELANVKALAGKTLGATNKGTPTDFAARLVLKQNGLMPDTNVKIAYLKEIPALVAAVKEGIIDAAMIAAPSTLTARNLGLKELVNVTALKIPYVQHAIATTRSYISSNEDMVRRFVRSAAEALDYTRTNRADILPIMSKFTKITDPAQLNEALDIHAKAWERIPMPSQTAIEAVIASSPNPKAKDAKWERFVDDRFVKELVAAGIVK
jgi:NitT/TauT family transport system substrate-binding protein